MSQEFLWSMLTVFGPLVIATVVAYWLLNSPDLHSRH